GRVHSCRRYHADAQRRRRLPSVGRAPALIGVGRAPALSASAGRRHSSRSLLATPARYSPGARRFGPAGRRRSLEEAPAPTAAASSSAGPSRRTSVANGDSLSEQASTADAALL